MTIGGKTPEALSGSASTVTKNFRLVLRGALDENSVQPFLKDTPVARALSIVQLTEPVVLAVQAAGNLRTLDTVTATLDCTGGFFSSQQWAGVRLDRLLRNLNGSSIRVVSRTGYDRRFPIEETQRLLLATRVGGRTLDGGHGYPARLVAPDRRGFWWVKWVVAIEVDDVPYWWQSPFPLQ